MVLRIAIMIPLLVAALRGQAVDEYQVKAAFLYNFSLQLRQIRRMAHAGIQDTH